MRRLFTLRWIGLHLLAVVLAGGCLLLGWWQLQRGQAGNARSWAYALEWPAFAIFVLFMWARMIYDEIRLPGRDQADRPAAPAPAPAAGANDEANAGAGAGAEDDGDPELAAYNRYLAELNARAERYRR